MAEVERADHPVVFLASRNAKKIAEMQRIMAEHVPGIEVLGLDDVAPYDEPAETEPTFEGNALIKARAGVAATGLPSIADDSRAVRRRAQRHAGRAVGPLGGHRRRTTRPTTGSCSQQLDDVPDERRAAHFTCAVAFVRRVGDETVEHVVHGTMPGRIIRELRGSGGFGYDVLFVADDTLAKGEERTSAELPPAEKDAISHRGRALRALAPVVAEALVRS